MLGSTNSETFRLEHEMTYATLLLLALIFEATTLSRASNGSETGTVNVQASHIYHPNLRITTTSEELRILRAYRRKLRAELQKSLLDQIAFDKNGDVLPGQKICLPLTSARSVAEIHIPGLQEGEARHVSLDPNLYIVRAMRSIIRGDFQDNVRALEVGADNQPPPATAHFDINYSNENDTPIDLGNAFELDEESFTITALIRLRAKTKAPIRGARLLSKRTESNVGWEFVVPSYYGQTISFYANEIPGHIDYGKSSLPENTWTVVGIIFDRDTYADNVTLITPYIDGYPDGQGTYLEVVGSLKNEAPLMVGHWKNEHGTLHTGRRDFRLPGFPRYNPHFQGDIREISIWKRALTKQNMRIHANNLLRKIGRRPIACPIGYQELDCTCYQVFNDMKTFAAAETRCAQEGGYLAMPKTQRVQDFLEILMQQSDKLSFWIGLDDRLEERVKIWADGTRCLYKRRRKERDFNKFPNSVPDKQYHTEDCVEQVKRTHDFWWNDENCIKLNAFICQVQTVKGKCSNTEYTT